MRAKTINLMSYSELYDIAPQEIKDYIDRCEDTPQGSYWHPEGNVGIHNRIVYNRAIKFGDLNLSVAAFFHDLGKADTTAPNKKGGYSAIGHEVVSAKLVKKYREWIESLGADFDEVYGLVDDHMRVKQFDEMKPAKQEDLRQRPHFDKLNHFTGFDNMKTLKPGETDV